MVSEMISVEWRSSGMEGAVFKSVPWNMVMEVPAPHSTCKQWDFPGRSWSPQPLLHLIPTPLVILSKRTLESVKSMIVWGDGF